jgi:death-on-curing protein
MIPPLKIGQPRFLSREEVLLLHAVSLRVYGGADGFLNEGAFESALSQAQQGFGEQYAHEFPFGMASAYGFHLAMNHAFRDGNKRTAFASMAAFLRANGWNLELQDEQAADLMLRLITERRDKAWLAAELERVARARPSFELRDFLRSMSMRRVNDQLAAMVKGKEGEILATDSEAEQSLPIVAELDRMRTMAMRGGDREMADQLDVLYRTFVAMCRIAEDMGYEW